MKPSLADIPFLQSADPALLTALDEEADWFSVPAGWAILSAGEPPEGVWFLMSGSLAASFGFIALVYVVAGGLIAGLRVQPRGLGKLLTAEIAENGRGGR